MVLTLEEPALDPDIIRAPAPPEGDRSYLVRLRNPYLAARDSQVTVALYIGTPPVLVDNCVVEDITWGWGASGDSGVLTTADAGGGRITLYDPLRRFDPANPANPVRIGNRIQLVVAGVPAFTGRVDDVTHDLTNATLSVVDDVSALAAIQFVETSVPAESTSARVKRILDLAAWPAGSRDIGTGGINLQAGTVAADAWSELIDVTHNELGSLWLTPAGVVTWRSRSATYATGSPVAVFGCPPSDTALTAMATKADQGDLVNVLAAARRTGTQATQTDQASLTAYGRHSHVQNDLEVATDGDRDLWSAFYLVRQAQPFRSVAGFTARPGAAAIAKCLGLPYGALVQVVDSGHGPDLTTNARWIGAKWDIQPSVIELTATLGQDQAVSSRARTATIDLPSEWQATAPWGLFTNLSYREPGLALTNIPAGP